MVHAGGEGVGAVGVGEANDTHLADAVSVSLGPDITHHLVRDADVRFEHAEHFTVGSAGVVDAGWQKPQAFLKEVKAVHGLGPGARASDIDHVSTVGGKTEQVAIEEDRAHLEEVGEVARAEIGIIQEDGIALLKLT